MSQQPVRYPLKRLPGARAFLVDHPLQPQVLVLLESNGDCGAELAVKIDQRRALTHPLLPRPLGLGWRGRRPGLLFRRFPPLDLEGLLRAPGTSERVVSVAARIADLLCYLHARGQPAGYFTPERLLGEGPEDLRVALKLPGSSGLPTDPRSIVYCAPELLQGESWTPAGDIFSLGRLFYRLFTGRRPIVETDTSKLLSKQLTTRPMNPRTLAPQLPGSLPELIEAMMARQPSKRPPAAQVLRELHQLVAPPPGGGCNLRAPLIGRNEEIRLLAGLCALQAAQPAPRLLLIRGPEGAGKSRLLETLTHLAEAHQLPFIRAREDGGLLSVEGGSLLEDTPTGLDDLLVWAEGRSLVATLDNAAASTCTAWVESLNRPETGLLLAVEAPGSWPVETLPAAVEVKTVELNALSQDQMERMMSQAVGTPPDQQPEALRRMCRLGRPLYWFEAARSFTEDGRLHYQAGRWAPRAGAGCDATLATFERRLGDRLRGLSPAARELLEALAIVENAQPFEFLLLLSGLSATQLEQLLAELEAEQFVRLSGQLRRTRFRIEHEWIRRVVEADLTPATGKKRHRQVASALESLAERNQSADPEIAVRIAGHRIRAGLPPSPWLQEAVATLRKRHRFERASRLIGRAWEAGVISEDDDSLVNEYIELLLLAGDLSRCARMVNSRLSNPSIGPRQRAHLYWLLGRMHLVRGERRKAIAALQQAITHSPSEESLSCELKCELLCLSALTRDGDNTAALRSELRQLSATLSDPPEKLWHALFVDAFFGPEGEIDRAIRHGVRSAARLAAGGDSLRLLGRLFNLSHSLLTVGSLDCGDRLGRYVDQEARTTGNQELAGYCAMNQLLAWRREGLHGRVLERLDQLRRGRRNPHLVIERRLERIKSLLYLGRLAEADQCLARLEESPTEFRPSAFELQLLRGWWNCIGGRSSEAVEIARELLPVGPHHFYGRAGLLLSRALLDSEADAAAEAASESLQSFGAGVPYHRLKALIALADAEKRRGAVERAQACLDQAHLLLPLGRWAPLAAAIRRRQASLLRSRDELKEARAHCLRAQQIARRVERPLMQASLLVELARIEKLRGQRRVAAGRLDQAIGTVRSVAENLTGELAPQFTKGRLNPLLVLSWRLFRGNREMPSDLLAALSHFSRSDAGPGQTARLLVEAVRETLPSASVRLYLADSSTGNFRLMASHGCFRVAGSELHRAARDCRDEVLLTRFESATTICGLPLRQGPALAGLIQLETPDELIEPELDFLSCLASLTTFKLPRRNSYAAVGSSDSDRIELEGGQVLVIRSRTMVEVVELASRAAGSNAAVIVEGESGTGKELISRIIHERSARKSGPFVPVNCAAIPEELIENELFGNVEGSFTGARGKIGLFEAADQGTLFLDEIASMPMSVQSRLLRVLQEGTIRRIGEHRERRVDVRIVAATNRPLKAMVGRKEFREDLFHRLNVFRLEIPPLRYRPEDILPLADHFLTTFNRRHDRRIRLSRGASQVLKKYHFPGNVRELKNLIEGLFHTSSGHSIPASLVATRLEPDWNRGSRDERIESILATLHLEGGNFWNSVREPFLKRDLSRQEVRDVVAAGLAACDGSYRRLTEHFGLAPEDYKRFLNFLRDHRCRVDFRPYREAGRRGNGGAGQG